MFGEETKETKKTEKPREDGNKIVHDLAVVSGSQGSQKNFSVILAAITK